MRSRDAYEVYYPIVTLNSKLIAFGFFNNFDYSDITILLRSSGIEIPAYRIILVYRSPYLYNELIKYPQS